MPLCVIILKPGTLNNNKRLITIPDGFWVPSKRIEIVFNGSNPVLRSSDQIMGLIALTAITLSGF